MDETQNTLADQWLTASRRMAELLEPDVCTEWHKELLLFDAAQLQICDLTPMSRAIISAIWHHINTGEELFFPPEAAAHYRRALRAHTN
jgi:hypothetical protein